MVGEGGRDGGDIHVNNISFLGDAIVGGRESNVVDCEIG